MKKVLASLFSKSSRLLRILVLSSPLPATFLLPSFAYKKMEVVDIRDSKMSDSSDPTRFYYKKLMGEGQQLLDNLSSKDSKEEIADNFFKHFEQMKWNFGSAYTLIELFSKDANNLSSKMRLAYSSANYKEAKTYITYLLSLIEIFESFRQKLSQNLRSETSSTFLFLELYKLKFFLYLNKFVLSYSRLISASTPLYSRKDALLMEESLKKLFEIIEKMDKDVDYFAKIVDQISDIQTRTDYLELVVEWKQQLLEARKKAGELEKNTSFSLFLELLRKL